MHKQMYIQCSLSQTTEQVRFKKLYEMQPFNGYQSQNDVDARH